MTRRTAPSKLSSRRGRAPHRCLGALLAAGGLFSPGIAAGDTAPPPAAPPAPDRPTQGADAATEGWAARDRALDEGPTDTGGAGLLRLRYATGAIPGQVRVGLVGEGFSSGFLCTPQYPCRDPRGGAPITSDSVGHTGATLAIGAGLAKLGPGVLEAFVAASALTTAAATNTPSLLPNIGDTTLGVGYGAAISSVFSAAGLASVRVPASTGDASPDFGGTSAAIGGLLTGDLRPVHAPLRFGVNLGYTLDNGAHGLEATEAARGAPVSRVERFAFGANRVDHVDARLGVEALLLGERIRPFVEYGLLVPVNRQGYTCRAANVNADGCLGATTVVPSTLTIGGRFLPWKRGFSVLAALDVGVTGTSTFIEELAPTAPWMLHLGIGWAFDTQDRPPVVREVVKAAPPRERDEGAKLAHLHGIVRDEKGPIAGARLRYDAHPELFGLATNDEGAFGDEIKPGDYTLVVDAEGYTRGTCAAHVEKAGADVAVDCPLTGQPATGTVVLALHDVETGAPVEGAQVEIAGGTAATGGGAAAKAGDGAKTSNASGVVRFDGVAPGTTRVTIADERHLTLVTTVDVQARETMRLDWMLRTRPSGKGANVTIGADGVHLARPIEFDGDGASIAVACVGELAELADALARHPELKKIEVQAHSDASGAPDTDRRVTQARADAVRAWLVAHGVGEERIAARGYGAERPVVPNVTTANRARNRRVEIVVVERDHGGAQGASAVKSEGGRS